jgi:O-antigen/teichoic acid export membrane protein
LIGDLCWTYEMSQSFLQSVTLVSAASAASQLIGIGGYLILARLFEPAAFGVYGAWLAIVAVGSVFSTGALQTTLVRDASPEVMQRSTALILAATGIGVAIFGTLYAGATMLYPNLKAEGTWGAMPALVIATYALSGHSILQAWAAASGQFKALIQLRLIQSIAIVLLPLLLSLTHRTADQLIWGHAIGLALSFICWFGIFGISALRWDTIKGLGAYCAQRRDTFLYALPGVLISVVTWNVPILAVQARFGEAIAGHLALCQRILSAPLTLVGTAVSEVFRRHAAEAYMARGNCVAEFRQGVRLLTAIAVPFAIVLGFFSEPMFALAFGQQWRAAGTMAWWLLPLFTMSVVASPLTYLVFVTNHERFNFYWQLGLFIAVLIAILGLNGAEFALRAYAWVYAAMYLVYLLACSRFARGR